MIRCILLFVLSATLIAAEEKPAASVAPTYDDIIEAARDAEGKGLVGKATELLLEAVRLDPKRPEAWFYRANILIVQEKRKEAITVLDQLIELAPKVPGPYFMRAQEHFRLGQIEQACADFDKYITLNPKLAAKQWQRGIALYEAGRFDDARKQFELHQTDNPKDVENAAWHFLCVARVDGFEKARENLIPITGDTRVPMAQIFRLFAGQGTEDDVFKATLVGKPNPEQLNAALFYAHLYLGLFYEAKGDEKKAFENIKIAATKHAPKHYMGDVARVHFQRLLRKPKPAAN
jgi:lipoprotein NlpI